MKFIKTLAIIFISIFVFLMMIRSCSSSSDTSNTTDSSPDSLAVDTSILGEDSNENTWQYAEQQDKMTSTTTYYAEVEATEKLEFDFPYNGGSTATLTIRNSGGENNAYLSVTKGQMLTKSYESTSYRVRFDDQSLQYYSFVGPSDNRSTMAFINNTAKFIRNLKKAKRVIIELEFYNEGLRPIEFKVAGLKWNH